MKKMNLVLAAFCILAFIPACGLMMKKKVNHIEAIQNTPVNCQTAQADIKVLMDEKVNVAEQVAAGVTSIAPPALVMGILTGTEESKLKIAVGDYNSMMDARIAKIKRE